MGLSLGDSKILKKANIKNRLVGTPEFEQSSKLESVQSDAAPSQQLAKPDMWLQRGAAMT